MLSSLAKFVTAKAKEVSLAEVLFAQVGSPVELYQPSLAEALFQARVAVPA